MHHNSTNNIAGRKNSNGLSLGDISDRRVIRSMSSPKQPPPHQSWVLGVMSEKHPEAIMAECYRVLRLCDYEWKTVTKFHVRVRPVARRKRAMSMQKKRKSFFGSRERRSDGREMLVPSNDNVKFEVQVYRVNASQCLLDFKRLSNEGTTMGFLVTVYTIISCLNLTNQ
jgi:hypothetical protein